MAKTVIIPRPLQTRKSGSRAKEIIGKFVDSGCLECISHACSDSEYPATTFGGKKDKIHRWVYILRHGEIPKGMLIRHTCDNPKCINIEHLLIGTHKENEADKKERDRHLKGEKNHRSKLKEIDVISIKKLLKTDMKQTDIAKIFKVSPSTIWLISKNKKWKHLGEL